MTHYIRRARIHRGCFVGMRGPLIAAPQDLAGAKRRAAELSREGGIFGVYAPIGPDRFGVVAWYRGGAAT